jgi:AcrR family transcriptional regulator
MSPKRLFLKKGFRETTTRDIAREAGINLSNPYHYFASKDELFRQLLKPATDTLEAMLNEHHHIAPGGADVEENCRLAVIIATGFHFLSVYSQREILETAHIGQFLTVDSIVDSIRGAVSPSRRAASA